MLAIFSFVHGSFDFDYIVNIENYIVFLGEIEIDYTSAVTNLSLQEYLILVFFVFDNAQREDLKRVKTKKNRINK